MRTKEYMCFNQNRTPDISTLTGSSLKLLDKFIYIGSCVSSTENDIHTRLAKAWSAIDKLSVIWKSDLSDKIKRIFFQSAVVSILQYEDAPDGGWLSGWRKGLMAIVQEYYGLYWTNLGSNISQNSSDTVTYLLSLKPFKVEEQHIQDTTGEVRTSS